MVENNEIVWEKVCAMQESAGMTVADISTRSGVPLTTVKRYFKGETKNPGFFQVCQIIHALDGSVDDVIGLDTGQQPTCYAPTDERFCNQLSKDLSYERKSKHKWQLAFVVLCVLVMLMMLIDIFNPQLGYIRYHAIQSMMAPGDMAARILHGLSQL